MVHASAFCIVHVVETGSGFVLTYVLLVFFSTLRPRSVSDEIGWRNQFYYIISFAQKAQVQKQLLRDQQDEQFRLDRRAWDEAGMQALSRYEPRRVEGQEERRLAKFREDERERALCDQEVRGGLVERRDRASKAMARIDRGRPRLTPTEVAGRRAIWSEQELVRFNRSRVFGRGIKHNCNKNQ
jgi:hypothetical protein